MINRAIINASPLIVLFKSQQAELIPQLFTEILIPEAVWHEILATGQNDAASQQLPNTPWLRRVELTAVAPAIAAWDLGAGESQVLSLCLNTSNYAAIVDDRAARRCAQTLSIPTLGTGGILVLAKRRGLISSISPRIQALRDAGLWLSDELVNLLEKQAGE